MLSPKIWRHDASPLFPYYTHYHYPFRKGKKIHHANSKSIRTREVRATIALYIDPVALENKEATPRGITKSDGGIMEGQMRRYGVAFRKPAPAVL